jgi:hypothetical protein
MDFDANVVVLGTLAAPTITKAGVPVLSSNNVNDVVTITQAAYDALGASRPAGRLYIVIG